MNTLFFLFLLWIVSVSFLSGCAAGRVGGSFADRYFEIAAKLDAAELRGARDCSPRELAHARVELEEAFHEANEPHYPRAWVHAEFDKAEVAADKLLAAGERRTSQGVCP